MKPWDTKMTYQLNDAELMQFVSHLESERVIEDERAIFAAVASVEEWWLNQRSLPQWQGPSPALRIPRRTTLGWYRENDTVPPASVRYGEIIVNLPPWVPSEMVRYLAEMQIREQWGEQ